MRLAAAVLFTASLLQAPVVRRPSPPPAPQPDAQFPTIRVQSRLVSVAVNVTDSRGFPVGGLVKGDFRISEDGKPQPISVFERESATPLSIVLALDTSESVLRNERLEKDAARQFVKGLLRDQDEIDLMDFSDAVREIVPFTNQRKRIDAGLNELLRGDETALYDAVYLGSQRLGETRADAGRRRVLVLITDGTDTTRRGSYTAALEQAQRAGVMIFPIIIVPVAADAGRNTGGEHALIQMADDTGGRYYYVEDPRDLLPAFQHISDDLRTQYVLGYYAPRRPQEGDESPFRHIHVDLTREALAASDRLRYRKGYYSSEAR